MELRVKLPELWGRIPEDEYSPFVKVPAPSRKQHAEWVLAACNTITDGELCDVCWQAHFPDGMAFSRLVQCAKKGAALVDPAGATSSTTSFAVAPVADASDSSSSSDSDSESRRTQTTLMLQQP